ncbi:unnamed protein product [Arabidopsis thaliana]|uniref:Uncharacterized protein n=1 Tax=Arabidopsis thaliana TaxID=3702 RepID=A0A654ELR4_ARATH|nr:unnamed protein product [Arabidopsis thaliana]
MSKKRGVTVNSWMMFEDSKLSYWSLFSLILVLDGDHYWDIDDDGWEVLIYAPGLSYFSLKVS